MLNATLCAPNRVSRAEVRAVPAPEFTQTWHPFSHGECLTALDGAVAELGLQVVSEQFSLTKAGTRMFGVIEIGNGTNKEMNMAVGFRNGIDKHFAWGCCTGSNVFVCSNLMFAAKFAYFRMHTGGLTFDELVIGTVKIVRQVISEFDDYTGWLDSLKEQALYDSQATVLTIAAMRKGLIPPSKYNDFHELYYDLNTKYSPSLHGFHGAVTELMKTDSLLTISEKNTRLNRFIKHEAPLLLDLRKHHDFKEVSDVAYGDYIQTENAEMAKSRETSARLKAEAKKEAQMLNTPKANSSPVAPLVKRAKKSRSKVEEPPTGAENASKAPPDLNVGPKKTKGKIVTSCSYCKSIIEPVKKKKKGVTHTCCPNCGEELS